MPEPKPNEESKKEWMERCTPYLIEEGTADGWDQAWAICDRMWEEETKAEARWFQPVINLFRRLVEFAQDWTWVKDKAKYLFEGRDLDAGKLKNVVESWMADEIIPGIERTTDRFLDGAIDLAQWQDEMAAHMKDGHLASAMAGRGGEAVMTPHDWGKAGSRIKEQYRYLNRFADDIKNKDLTPAQIKARARQYGRSCQQSFYDGMTEANRMGEYTEERRVLSPVENCPDCVAYAALGWQPIGALPEPGEKSVCNVNCRCVKEYR